MKWLRYVFACAMLCSFVSCAQESSFTLELATTAATLTEAREGTLRYWHFSEEQQRTLASVAAAQDGAALAVTISVQPPKKATIPTRGAFGFLYEEDFAATAKLRADRQKRAQVSADFASLSTTSAVSLLLCVNREGVLPAGFYIDTALRYTVQAAAITQPAVGYDYTQAAPLYAFAPNGGTVESWSRSFDFSGVPLAFPAVNTAQSCMPTLYLLTAPSANANATATSDGAPTENATAQTASVPAASSDIYAVLGGERLTLRKKTQLATAQTEASITALPCAALRAPFSAFAVSQNQQLVLSALVRSSDRALLSTSPTYSRAVLKPIFVDPGLIMEWRRDNWRGRDYELFAWDRFPHVLIFDTVSYAVQDDFFRRLAFFTEKAGYTGRLMSDSFLEKQHGYNAHDYRAESLAAFFELARVTEFPLNSRELLLKEILTANGVLKIASDGTVYAGDGAVISISQESPVNLRWTFIAHEGWHGIFFTDDEFRNTVASIYYTMDQRALNALIKYFAVTPTLNYDTHDDYLMKNEFMAYMLQRPLSQTRQYYLNLAARPHAQQTMKRDADYILQTNADGYVSAATMLEQYVSERWNLAAGRVWLVNRQQEAAGKR